MPPTGSLKRYLPLSSLNTSDANTIRMPWDPPLGISFTGFVVGGNDIDRYEPYRIELRHANDTVTFKPRITIRIIKTHQSTKNVFENVMDEQITVTTELTIRNEGGTIAYPGVWRIDVYPVC